MRVEVTQEDHDRFQYNERGDLIALILSYEMLAIKELVKVGSLDEIGEGETAHLKQVAHDTFAEYWWLVFEEEEIEV